LESLFKIKTNENGFVSYLHILTIKISFRHRCCWFIHTNSPPPYVRYRTDHAPLSSYGASSCQNYWAEHLFTCATTRNNMINTTTPPLDPRETGYRLDTPSNVASAVSWGAIVAGAAAAAALSLILMILGVGLGLSSVSPWAYEGISAASFGISTILWLTVTQLLSSGLGGYLAGRLRTKWMDAHTDEIFFRDTAHGFLAWAIASLATATLLASVVTSIVGGGIQAGASVAGGMANSATMAASSMANNSDSSKETGNNVMGYFVDSLFRRDNRATGAPTTSTDIATDTASVSAQQQGQPLSQSEIQEVTRIFMNLDRTEPLPLEDIQHVGQMVSERTGLTQREAEKRVTEVYARAQARLNEIETAAKDTADEARKASAYAALWIFVSLLIGAFVASLAATMGGRQRDA
jgi:hypothetical protein